MSAIVEQNPALMEVNPPLVQSADYHDLTNQISQITEGRCPQDAHEVLDYFVRWWPRSPACWALC